MGQERQAPGIAPKKAMSKGKMGWEKLATREVGDLSGTGEDCAKHVEILILSDSEAAMVAVRTAT